MVLVPVGWLYCGIAFNEEWLITAQWSTATTHCNLSHVCHTRVGCVQASKCLFKTLQKLYECGHVFVQYDRPATLVRTSCKQYNWLVSVSSYYEDRLLASLTEQRCVTDVSSSPPLFCLPALLRFLFCSLRLLHLYFHLAFVDLSFLLLLLFYLMFLLFIYLKR